MARSVFKGVFCLVYGLFCLFRYRWMAQRMVDWQHWLSQRPLLVAVPIASMGFVLASVSLFALARRRSLNGPILWGLTAGAILLFGCGYIARHSVVHMEETYRLWSQNTALRQLVVAIAGLALTVFGAFVLFRHFRPPRNSYVVRSRLGRSGPPRAM